MYFFYLKVLEISCVFWYNKCKEVMQMGEEIRNIITMREKFVRGHIERDSILMIRRMLDYKYKYEDIVPFYKEWREEYRNDMSVL